MIKCLKHQEATEISNQRETLLVFKRKEPNFQEFIQLEKKRERVNFLGIEDFSPGLQGTESQQKPREMISDLRSSHRPNQTPFQSKKKMKGDPTKLWQKLWPENLIPSLLNYR